MSTLIVTAHPDTGSLTHQAAQALQDLLGAEVVGTAHLAQEGFDPRSTSDDRRAYLGRGRPGPDVAAEQERIDRAEHLVLVFPVHWWSLPALLKGWVDRVFVAGWAFDDEEGKIVPRLQRLTAHLLPIAGAQAGVWARHGYAQAFAAQVEHGVLDFCGARRGATAFVHDAEADDKAAVGAAVDAAVAAIASAIIGVPARTGHAVA